MKMGNTQDGNEYPILYARELEGDESMVIGVPVDDYQAIVEHLKTIDDQLSGLEEKLDIKSDDAEPYVIEWLYKNRDKGIYPIEYTTPSLKKFLSNDVPQWQKDLTSDKTGITPKVMFCGQPTIDALNEVYAGILEAKMPEHISFKVETVEPYIKVSTWLHTIILGVHREQEFSQKYYIGYNKPDQLPYPLDQNIMDMDDDDEINDYCAKVEDYKDNKADIEDWLAIRDDHIDRLKADMRCVIEVWVKQRKMCVAKEKGKPYTVEVIDINPFAYWIAPDDNIPLDYQWQMLKGVN